jgi:hypothetical protein
MLAPEHLDPFIEDMGSAQAQSRSGCAQGNSEQAEYDGIKRRRARTSAVRKFCALHGRRKALSHKPADYPGADGGGKELPEDVAKGRPNGKPFVSLFEQDPRNPVLLHVCSLPGLRFLPAIGRPSFSRASCILCLVFSKAS